MTNGSSNLLKTPPIESTLLVTTEKCTIALRPREAQHGHPTGSAFPSFCAYPPDPGARPGSGGLGTEARRSRVLH